MSQLLAAAPAGNLICLEFPTYKDPSLGGPPFALSPAVYVEHLSHPGEQLAYDDKGHIKQNPLRRASPGGLERVAHWQPERTHEIGRGSDWASGVRCSGDHCLLIKIRFQFGGTTRSPFGICIDQPDRQYTSFMVLVVASCSALPTRRCVGSMQARLMYLHRPPRILSSPPVRLLEGH